MAGATGGKLQIGDVAERTGLSLRTIRHYEEVGLLPPSERSPGGFRLYTDAAVEQLLVIKQMKPLEFTLEQMRELLEVLDELDAGSSPQHSAELHNTVSEYQQLVAERVGALRRRLRQAQLFEASLRRATRSPGRAVTQWAGSAELGRKLVRIVERHDRGAPR